MAIKCGAIKCIKTFDRASVYSVELKILYPQEADEVSLWQQDPNQNVHQDQLLHGQHQYFSLLNEDDEDEFMVDSWRHANPFHNPVTSIQGDVQVLNQLA